MSDAEESSRQARAERLVRAIEEQREFLHEAFFDIGEALCALQDEALYVVLGYPHIEGLIADRALLPRAQAHKLMAIVRTVPRAEALFVGPEKAYEIVRSTRGGATAGGGVKKKADKAAALDDDPGRHAAVVAVKEAERELRARGIGSATVELRKREGTWVAVVIVPTRALPELFGS